MSVEESVATCDDIPIDILYNAAFSDDGTLLLDTPLQDGLIDIEELSDDGTFLLDTPLQDALIYIEELSEDGTPRQDDDLSLDANEPSSDQSKLTATDWEDLRNSPSSKELRRFKFVNGHIFCKDCKCAINLPHRASGRKTRIVRGAENHLRNKPHLRTMVNLLDQKDARFKDFLCETFYQMRGHKLKIHTLLENRSPRESEWEEIVKVLDEHRHQLKWKILEAFYIEWGSWNMRPDLNESPALALPGNGSASPREEPLCPAGPLAPSQPPHPSQQGPVEQIAPNVSLYQYMVPPNYGQQGHVGLLATSNTCPSQRNHDSPRFRGHAEMSMTNRDLRNLDANTRASRVEGKEQGKKQSLCKVKRIFLLLYAVSSHLFRNRRRRRATGGGGDGAPLDEI